MLSPAYYCRLMTLMPPWRLLRHCCRRHAGSRPRRPRLFMIKRVDAATPPRHARAFQDDVDDVYWLYAVSSFAITRQYAYVDGV